MDYLNDKILSLRDSIAYGRVLAVRGLTVEIGGPVHEFAIGSILSIIPNHNTPPIHTEIVGFRDSRALCLPFAGLEGVKLGAKTYLTSEEAEIFPHASWLGRIVDAMGKPLDGGGVLKSGNAAYGLRKQPPNAAQRQRVGAPINLGVRALNCFTTCCYGQRMGIFAGSGVGKSILISMLARNTAADVTIIGLIGERGRELREFIEEDLGKEGLARAILVVSTSDESPVMRRRAAHLTLTLAEYFRDEGKNVLCVMDSVTRFAMAQREISLSVGEPPATRGYTPTVFAELPKLLERAGPGIDGQGSITGLFTVLVEGDDLNEPISDAVRGILDGHIVMDRAIAERGRFPAINILKSVSRTMPACVPPDMRPFLQKARALMADYADMEELIRMGAYRPGTRKEIDASIAFHEPMEEFLRQDKIEKTQMEDDYASLRKLLMANDTQSSIIREGEEKPE